MTRTEIIIIDTPKFSFIKYKDDGSMDYPSPIPFTVNYGRIADTISEEGDNADAIVLGKRYGKGSKFLFEFKGVVEFEDRGKYDPKYIYSDKSVSSIDKINVRLFFTLFSYFKIILNKLRGKKGKTRLISIEYLS